MKLQTFFSLLALASILSLGPLSGQAQFHGYMDVTGKPDGAFKGASTKAKHKPVLEAPLIMAITRKDAGSTKHGPLSFTKEVDDSSPSLWQAHTSNEVLPELSFMVYKPGDESKWKVVTFNNAIINGVTVKKVAKNPNGDGRGKANQQPAPSSTGDQEELTFTFEKISVVYYSGGNVSTTDDWNTPGQ
jgi:type VI secretion system secreted protein Hcp